jgi:hypothetical protein
MDYDAELIEDESVGKTSTSHLSRQVSHTDGLSALLS